MAGFERAAGCTTGSGGGDERYVGSGNGMRMRNVRVKSLVRGVLPSTTTGGNGRKDNISNNVVNDDNDGGAFADSVDGSKYDCREKAMDRSHSGVGTDSNDCHVHVYNIRS